MSDAPAPVRLTTPTEVPAALREDLSSDRGRVDKMMARIVAEQLVRYLDQAGFAERRPA